MKKYILNFKVQLIIVFFLLTILCYLFPYTGDDWAWGTSVGIERLMTAFKNYNGRYFGNILVLIFTRSHIAKSLFMAAVLEVLCYQLYIFVNKDNKKLFWISLLFVLLTPKLVMAQTIVWLSGFTNYVVPTLMILMYFNLFRYVFDGNFEFKKTNCVYAVILGFLNSLIMENITIFNIFISIAFLVYTFIKYKKIDYAQICFLLASVLGTILMFSNGAYHMIVSSEDSYRNIAQEGNKIQLVVNLYFDKICHMFFLQNNLICIMISIFAIIINNEIIRNLGKKFIKYILYFINFVFVFFSSYLILKMMYPTWKVLMNNTNYFEGIITLIWCLSLLIIVLLRFSKSDLIRKAFVAEMSFVVLLAPLFFVNPIWNRNVFPLYVMLVLLFLCLYQYANIKMTINKSYLIILNAIVYAYLVSIYGNVYVDNRKRITYIENKKDTVDTLYIKKLPYRDYLWMSEPNGEMWEERFKLFYKIPQEIKIKIRNK